MFHGTTSTVRTGKVLTHYSQYYRPATRSMMLKMPNISHSQWPTVGALKQPSKFWSAAYSGDHTGHLIPIMQPIHLFLIIESGLTLLKNYIIILHNLVILTF
jgi:hypothetical protein